MLEETYLNTIEEAERRKLSDERDKKLFWNGVIR